MIDLLVVGAGLTGLFAAWQAARRGARCMLVSYGRGGLELSSGCLGVASAGPPDKQVSASRLPHPYALVGKESLRRAMEALLELLETSGLPYVGSLDSNLELPTAAGGTTCAAYAPRSLVRFLDAGTGSVTLAGFTGFRDFDSVLASNRLSARLKRPIAAADLPLPGSLSLRDLYSTDLARRFENPGWLAQACAAWRPSLIGVRHLGLPAVLGFRQHVSVLAAIEDALELTVFEIPTLPPCLPGLRLEAVLREACLACGVDLIEGATSVGRVDGRTGGARAAGIIAQTAGGPQVIDAGAVLLATGDLLHGGLVARQNGRLQESVFDLPVVHSNDRSTWTAPHVTDPQPYATFGLRVDAHMRPLGADGAPLMRNLFAAGGLLAGARRTEEGSRQGIGLATAWRAVESALS